MKLDYAIRILKAEFNTYKICPDCGRKIFLRKEKNDISEIEQAIKILESEDKNV